ncbi:MAG: PAS domain-containing protein [Bacteroidetes bacterium]|nr:PAS domain-containing protein [Bacteroidota bacterium]
MEVHPLTGVTDGEIVIMRSEITDQKRTEEEMKLLINNTEESFILLDKDLKIVSFNNQFQNLYKKYLRLHVKKGDFIINYAQPDRKKAVMEIYQRVLKGNVEFSSIEIPISETEIKSFSMKFNPARDNFGNIFGVFVTAADITEIKQAELLKDLKKR